MKTVAWTLIQNHPAYIALKLALCGLAALAVLVIAFVAYLML